VFNVLKPDAGSYNRLLVSLGILSFAAGLVLPWLLLRDTTALQVSQNELAQLTPSARETLIQRQDLIQSFQTWIWLAPATFIPVGLGLVVVGAVGLRSQQQLENRRLAAEVTKGEREATYEPQSEGEREEKLIDDAVLAAVDTPLSPDDRSPEPVPDERASPSDTRASQVATWVDEVRTTETMVLARLQNIIPPNYVSRPRYKVSRGDSSLLLDALLRSNDPTSPDVIVEVKSLRSPRPPRILMDEAIAQAIRYRRITGRPAWTWLIVVVHDPDPQVVARIHTSLSRNNTPDLVQVTVITDVEEIQVVPKAPAQDVLALF
jgi:hypothetical protein